MIGVLMRSSTPVKHDRTY